MKYITWASFTAHQIQLSGQHGSEAPWKQQFKYEYGWGNKAQDPSLRAQKEDLISLESRAALHWRISLFTLQTGQADYF